MNNLNVAKVLVVEDEVNIGQLIGKGLEMEGYRVDLAHDGEKGLESARKNEHDLIILDLMLPKINGLEVCRILRAENIKTPVIILTARDSIEDREAGLDAGADDYLPKPFAFTELVARIKAILRREKIKQDEVQAAGDDKLFKVCATESKKLAELNRRIMDNIPVSIMTINRRGEVTSVNKYFYIFSNSGDFRGLNIFKSDFFIRENLDSDFHRLLERGETIRRENCHEKNIYGEDKYLTIVAVPLRDAHGNIDGAVSMASDNTEAVLYKNELEKLNRTLEKKVEVRTEELNRANQELARVLQLKSNLISDISHELRTSLTIIQSNLELASRALSPKDAQTSDQIFAEIKRMSDMLSNLTLLINSSGEKLKLEKVDLNRLISSVLASFGAAAREKNIRLEQKKGQADIEIMADGEMIRKLLTNLISNAIRYNKKNGWVKARVEAGPDEVILSVEDGGVGIAQEHLPLIFERFYRVDKDRSRVNGGSGLGLAICQSVAESHGGQLEVKSETGHGSLFTARLPRQRKLIDL
ncbi:MAG: response regulator [bacterium]|nr:response regulator [bacterium]